MNNYSKLNNEEVGGLGERIAEKLIVNDHLTEIDTIVCTESSLNTSNSLST